MEPSAKQSLDSGSQKSTIEDVRTGLTVGALKQALADNLYYVQGKFRSFLLSSLQNYLANEADRARCLKPHGFKFRRCGRGNSRASRSFDRSRRMGNAMNPDT